MEREKAIFVKNVEDSSVVRYQGIIVSVVKTQNAQHFAENDRM